jgi:flagellar FliL protein
MSAAVAVDAGAPKKGKKKLIVIGSVVALLLAGSGGGAFFMMKKKAAAEEGEEAHSSQTAKDAAASRDPKVVPTFVPLETFTVNLADRNADRFAQVGITLQVEDPKLGDQIKAYMPAIRNNILMTLADRTAAELLEREGKARLAEKIRRETSRALGYEVGEPKEEEATSDEGPKKKRRKKAEEALPVTAVHFSNFIIQ